MVSEQDRMRRLAFSKYLIEIGNINADNVLPFSATALMNFHDALEFLFGLILDDNGIYPRKREEEFSFMDMFNKCNTLLKKKGYEKSSLGASLNKFKNKRVDIKHKGSFPSPQDIDEAKYTTINLFNDFCLKFYQLNYEDIDLIDILDDSRTKDCLLNIKDCTENNDIIYNFALAFEYLLKDFESSKTISGGRSPYALTKERQVDASEISLDNYGPISNYIDVTNDNIAELEKNLKIFAFGINYNKYAHFKFLIPVNVHWAGNHYEPNLEFIYKPLKLNSGHIEFCKNFIIESALKLQQFDFEIPDDFALTNSLHMPLSKFF